LNRVVYKTFGLITFSVMITFILLAIHALVPIGPSHSVLSKEEVLTKPSFEHLLTSKHVFLDTLELEDRSRWVIAPPDVYKITGWEPNDVVVLTPHSSFFSIYKFQFSLSNLTRKSYVRVNLDLHPCDYKKKCRWVISLDKFGNRLFLNDGSSWKIHPDDTLLLQDWDLNDFIVYGKNDQLLTSFPFLLINARLNHYIRAIEF
jgi:hypothetical protein